MKDRGGEDVPTNFVVVLCAVSFALGLAALYILTAVINHIKARKERKKSPSESLFNRIGVMNFILVLIGIVMVWFTLEMIQIFKEYGSIPDTLVNCVFIATTGECGIMGWIKTTKDKYREREWRQEDAKSTGKLPEVGPGDLGGDPGMDGPGADGPG